METNETTTKIFKNGNSQAVRIPKAFRIEGDEVLIRKQGDQIIISSVKAPRPSWAEFFAKAQKLSDDFMAERDDSPPQERDWY